MKKSPATFFALLVLATLAIPAAQAQFTITESPDGLPLAGATLDNLSSQSDPLVTLNGASYVTGSVTGQYAAPEFSSSLQPATFGQTQLSSYPGQMLNQYISVFGNTTATLNFNSPQSYLGLLWGSVDQYNSLTFYNGSSVIGIITGTDIGTVAGNSNYGDWGFNEYANITSSTAFTKVVVASSQNSFEFADIAYRGFSSSAPGAPAPPMTACMAFAAVLILQALRSRRLAII